MHGDAWRCVDARPFPVRVNQCPPVNGDELVWSHSSTNPLGRKGLRGIARPVGPCAADPPMSSGDRPYLYSPTHIATPYKPNPQKICYIAWVARGVLNSLNMGGGFVWWLTVRT